MYNLAISKIAGGRYVPRTSIATDKDPCGGGGGRSDGIQKSSGAGMWVWRVTPRGSFRELFDARTRAEERTAEPRPAFSAPGLPGGPQLPGVRARGRAFLPREVLANTGGQLAPTSGSKTPAPPSSCETGVHSSLAPPPPPSSPRYKRGPGDSAARPSTAAARGRGVKSCLIFP